MSDDTGYDEDDQAGEPSPARSFGDYVELHNDGEESAEAGALMRKLVQAVQTFGGSGHVTVALTVAAKDDVMVATVAVSTKVPKAKPEPVIVFPDARGNVSIQPMLPGTEPEPSGGASGGAVTSVTFTAGDAGRLGEVAAELRRSELRDRGRPSLSSVSD